MSCGRGISWWPIRTIARNAVWLAGLYRGCWRVELDIRAIKCTLGMDILRAKTPAMVRTELWSCLLVYNLLRESMLQAARHSC